MAIRAAGGTTANVTGAILVAWDAEQLDALPALRAQAEANEYHACEIVDAATVYERLPHLGPGALGGLTVPDESIICTWTVNLALATDAVNRGADKRVRIHVDAENYRQKREQSLESLAVKVAGKVTKYRRSVTLEPMNAYERHVIHTALQEYVGVTTYSVGTEPNRRVIVAYDREKK